MFVNEDIIPPGRRTPERRIGMIHYRHELGFQGEPVVEDSMDIGEIWEILQEMLPDARERRLAYLLFHCGLKPREIVRFCPQEFNDIPEICRLRRNIMERLLRNTDQMRNNFTLL